VLLVGTSDGLLDLALDGTEERRTLHGTAVTAVSGDWAIADGGVSALDRGAAVDLPDGLVARCLLALDGGRALVGTSDARLFVLGGPEGTARDVLFDRIATRKRWSTPWGGPPDTRSITIATDTPFVGVHVGGVWRRDADGWVEVVPAEADDHQVTFGDGVLAVAAGIGVGQSDDRGDTWHWSDDGLHGRYSRSVAIADGWLLASASTGPGTREAAIYRRPLADPEAPFARCGGDALPSAFPYNVDTGELAASGPLVAVGTPTGEVFLSEDCGAAWQRIAASLPGVHCVAFAA
jgi:hypothetical protein